jgi:hypothetical protein
MMDQTHSRLIDELGGTAKVAAICHVSSQAVSKWRRHGIPMARLMYLKVAHPVECKKSAISIFSE